MKNYLSCINEDLKFFLSNIVPPYHVVEVARLGIECEEELLDPITNNVMNFPVKLNGKTFDFDTLDLLDFDSYGFAKNPFTRNKFMMVEITPDYELCAKIKHKILQTKISKETTINSLSTTVTEIDIAIKKAIEMYLNTTVDHKVHLNELAIPAVKLSELANTFNPEAQFLYAIYFEQGFNVSQSSTKYIKYLRYAVEQNLAIAQQCYAVCCELGIHGVQQDFKEAAKFYSLASKQRVSVSISNYGRCLALGKGVEKDPVQAALFFKTAALQGVVNAQYDYAQCCEDGFGVQKDSKEAEKYYEMAASNGFEKAIQKIKQRSGM